MIKMILTFLVIFSVFFYVESYDIPTTEINNTRLVGIVIKSNLNKDVFAFRGVPYAIPPKRFKEADIIVYEAESIITIYDKPLCPQTGLPPAYTMDENCLTLNVYTRNVSGNFPVMFYIHGGGFINGGSHSERFANPKYLLDKNIVLVTINYRLGPFGFLSTGTKEAPGNLGFKDQVLALKWVHKYIHKFGGDNGNVTIFGQSAGGMSVSLHLASQMSKGLFHRAIILSGASTSGIKPDNIYWTNKLANSLKCETQNKTNLLNCLKKFDYYDILKVCATWENFDMPSLKWNYEIENDFGQERFITEDPTATYANGRFNKVPIIAGYTVDEFATVAHYILKYNPKFLETINSHFDYYAPQLFQYSSLIERRKEITAAIKKFYLNNQNASAKNIAKFGEIFADSIINHGVHRLIELARKYIEVYYYRIDYKGRYTTGMYSESGMPITVSHSDDLQYLFVSKTYSIEFHPNDKEYTMVKRLTDYFTSFAIHNNPNHVDFKNGLKCIKWLPSKADILQTLFLNETCKLSKEPFKERYEFWDSLFPIKYDAKTDNAGNNLNVYGTTFTLISFTIIIIRLL